MEHVNPTNTRQQQLQLQLQQQHQQQQQRQQQQLQQNQLEQQQQHSDNQQQFCLRWHNHQTSLLSTLPVLLDQSQLTDVTISAEGRLLRAHRVVLSACSSFFMEIFRALEANNHPVIIIPGASFGAIVALLTFMYSGEVNVYEEQIPMLLNLAETLGIKGLADVHNNNLPKTAKSTPNASMEPAGVDKPLAFDATPTPSPAATPTATPRATPTPASTPTLGMSNATLQAPLLANKLGSPLENFFLKSLQFYPNLLPQPLNFSQTALNKTTELLAKYQQQCQLYQSNLEEEECYGQAKRLKTGSGGAPGGVSNSQKDIKRIDKIVENLRTSSSSSKSPMECGAPSSIVATSPVTLAPQAMSHFSPQLPVVKTSPSYSNSLNPAGHLYSGAKLPSYSAAATPTTAQQAAQSHLASPPYITPEDHVKLQQHIEQYAACQREAAAAAAAGQLISTKSEPNLLSLSAEKMVTPSKPPSNSKLYATCFICHKQLSNQYNLRVHLETHQNVRYACNVCSHVSRSKDALRKHVSYRHPGAPSPCENEARRKRVTKLAAQSISASAPTATATSGDMAAGEVPNTGSGSGSAPGSGSGPGSLSGNPYLFLPNQFQLAAAAAAVAVAESNTDVAHEGPVSLKSVTPVARNGEAGSETDTTTI
ncbi:PREDICTED: protein bric-a-brac 1 [Drosophila arizonae]|uniref:Protein bric-a-brac 1 n=1 Tax=Drosophila arizonae TaxID=7263 RepID=A0ABM1P740_DROAR|nr:PREDICTED: protein bric-a-brac 1 [Drosophila arizonae]XP_017863027.1 PREDICTED: protein bric-a-brac 1 [Drosophila arizonae]